MNDYMTPADFLARGLQLAPLEIQPQPVPDGTRRMTVDFRFGSLFSGIGGLDLGLERAGMECAWQVEIDDYATRVLEKHWPNVARYRDVRECGGHNLEPVDLICGGFPCQPHSLAGKRRASADERDLWGEFARIIRELKPRWVVGENVPGLLSSEHGRFFGRVLRDLAACGYDAEWQVLPASAFGAWHRRDRVFIIAYASSERRPLAVQSVRQSWSSLASHVGSDGTFQSVAYADGEREQQPRGHQQEGRRWSGDGSAEVFRAGWERCLLWATEPAVCELADGVSDGLVRYAGRIATNVPNRIAKLRCLGNAVVPQAAEYVGRLIVEATP